MAKKSKKTTELHPMLLKGILIGVAFSVVYMLYVNLLQNKVEQTESAVQGIYDSTLR